jgi:hypothetical protein
MLVESIQTPEIPPYSKPPLKTNDGLSRRRRASTHLLILNLIAVVVFSNIGVHGKNRLDIQPPHRLYQARYILFPLENTVKSKVFECSDIALGSSCGMASLCRKSILRLHAAWPRECQGRGLKLLIPCRVRPFVMPTSEPTSSWRIGPRVAGQPACRTRPFRRLSDMPPAAARSRRKCSPSALSSACACSLRHLRNARPSSWNKRRMRWKKSIQRAVAKLAVNGLPKSMIVRFRIALRRHILWGAQP